jgi:hypothetical protein
VGGVTVQQCRGGTLILIYTYKHLRSFLRAAKTVKQIYYTLIASLEEDVMTAKQILDS